MWRIVSRRPSAAKVPSCSRPSMTLRAASRWPSAIIDRRCARRRPVPGLRPLRPASRSPVLGRVPRAGRVVPLPLRNRSGHHFEKLVTGKDAACDGEGAAALWLELAIPLPRRLRPFAPEECTPENGIQQLTGARGAVDRRHPTGVQPASPTSPGPASRRWRRPGRRGWSRRRARSRGASRRRFAGRTKPRLASFSYRQILLGE